ncbi:UNVERIFIED_CONTAM: hypothetical protein FKN15_061576 [Acipenser sinensis]
MMQKMYEGCEIVMGNLEITLMEHSRNFSFLQSIREVTGYILIVLNQFDFLPLQNLRVIRGTSLYEDTYALAILLNYQKEGLLGLRQLGLTQLTEILEGGVLIHNNKFLCYAPQINWEDIVRDSDARVTIDENSVDENCSCHASCHHQCWGPGPDKCQNLTKTVCAPQCNGRCFGSSPSQCCHSFLNIQSWPKQFNDLSIFSNLTTIRGRTLDNDFSLLVMKLPNVTSLGLSSLREISSGNVYISDNPQLCFHHTINWSFLTKSKERQKTKIKNNRPAESCMSEGHLCDPLCSSNGCWGPGPDQCLSCRNYSREGTCVPDCHFNEGASYSTPSHSSQCITLHSIRSKLFFTLSPPVSLQGPDACVNCAHFQDGPHCVESCPEGIMGQQGRIFKYPNSEHRCESCHLNCTEGCTGPKESDCFGNPSAVSSLPTTGIVLGVLSGLIVFSSVFVLTVLYRRGLAIRRKRAMRRYLESGECLEPLDPGEKGSKAHARILKVAELRKMKVLGSGVFGTVHKGVWIPEGDSVKIPVAIKTIQDRSGRQTFHEVTEVSLRNQSPSYPVYQGHPVH